MRPQMLLTTLTAALALTSGACASGIRVRTTTAPDANLAGLHTFRVLNAPQRRADAPTLPQDDPMLNNSITNQALRQDLVQAFQTKGYTLDGSNPDFVVAYYAGTKEKMDTTYWNPDPYWRYGYRGFGYRGLGYRGWAWPWYGYAAPYPAMQLQEYTEGSVVVDVVDPKTKELLWRGQGVARVSDNPNTYANELEKTVTAILKKFPQA
jgi:hypothetical protein